MSFYRQDVKSQRTALRRLASLIVKGSSDPDVVRAARAITANVDARDDLGELEAIYDAVKSGTDRVPGLRHGLRYVTDPRTTDYYVGASRILKECKAGACAGDCDEATVLVASMAGALGFKVGARAWGKPSGEYFEHVYAVAAVPKKGPWDQGYGGHGMDTTVGSAYVGWEPPKGKVLTYWIEE